MQATKTGDCVTRW